MREETLNDDLLPDEDYLTTMNTTEKVSYETSEDVYGASYGVSFALGCVLLLLLLIDLLVKVFPTTARFGRNSFAAILFTAGGYRAESYHKQAASWKVDKMVNNALIMHSDSSAANSSSKPVITSGLTESAHVKALLKYQLQESETEVVGGVFWAWGKIFNGTLFFEEGVWIHSRILACNMAQLLVVRSLCDFLFLLPICVTDTALLT